MYTSNSPVSTFANICTHIDLQFLIFCLILPNCYGFKINLYETSTKNPPEPSEREAEWWESVIVVTLATFAVLGFFGFFLIVRRIWRRAVEKAEPAEEIPVQYNRPRPFHRQELADWPRPQQTEFYNPRSSLQDGFMVQLAADRHRPSQTTTRIQPRPITVNERPPQQIIRSANDTMDEPPPYDSAVHELGDEAVLPRKLPLEDASFDSDISIIESPPSYFTVQENFPTTRS